MLQTVFHTACRNLVLHQSNLDGLQVLAHSGPDAHRNLGKVTCVITCIYESMQDALLRMCEHASQVGSMMSMP